VENRIPIVTSSPLQLDGALAYPHWYANWNIRGLVNSLAVHERAISRAEVFHEPVVALREDAGVTRG
jgi:hypothetical protein